MPSELKTDASINGVVKVATDPKDRQGPTLSTKRVVETHITSRNHMTISLEETTGITMAFSPHYRSVHIYIYIYIYVYVYIFKKTQINVRQSSPHYHSTESIACITFHCS
jgi:hypothetical protein